MVHALANLYRPPQPQLGLPAHPHLPHLLVLPTLAQRLMRCVAKRELHVAKETYVCGKRDLRVWQKRPSPSSYASLYLASLRTRTHARTHARTQTHTPCASSYLGRPTHARTHARTHANTHTHTHTHTYTQRYTHTHTHAHTNAYMHRAPPRISAGLLPQQFRHRCCRGPAHSGFKGWGLGFRYGD